jgi:hypothetical protein
VFLILLEIKVNFKLILKKVNCELKAKFNLLKNLQPASLSVAEQVEAKRDIE